MGDDRFTRRTRLSIIFADLDRPQTFALRADEILGNERQTVEIRASAASVASTWRSCLVHFSRRNSHPSGLSAPSADVFIQKHDPGPKGAHGTIRL
jgi:hypothetical protein